MQITSQKRYVIPVLILFFSLMAAGLSLAVNNGPEEIILQTSTGTKPARFPHKKHQAMFKCEECHHTMTADGKKGPYVPGQEKKCESCHNKDFKNPELTSLKAVGHARCKECHKKMEAQGKPAPTKCLGCHIK
ncbi:MAG: cytochrome c3 family protein [Desulfobacteraceae bacterium]|nr:cytochrome c3 family protein [Desulfobacteraceae bacterium]